jgi:hypothetical protein
MEITCQTSVEEILNTLYSCKHKDLLLVLQTLHENLLLNNKEVVNLFCTTLKTCDPIVLESINGRMNKYYNSIKE